MGTTSEVTPEGRRLGKKIYNAALQVRGWVENDWYAAIGTSLLNSGIVKPLPPSRREQDEERVERFRRVFGKQAEYPADCRVISVQEAHDYFAAVDRLAGGKYDDE